MKKVLMTTIHQKEVMVLEPDDFDGYEYNRPSKEWELIEYTIHKNGKAEKIRNWVGNYSYTFSMPKIVDYKNVKIIGNE